MLTITARDNPRIKELIRLCSSAKERRESCRFVLEGVRLVEDALAGGADVESLFVTQEGLRRAGGRIDPDAAAPGCFLIDDASARRIAQTESTQGVFALCRGTLLRQGLPQRAERGCLMLVSLQDPGNVGTILRSADAFGLSAVILAGSCPDPTSPKVLRASMGAALRLPMFAAPDPAAAVDALKSRGVAVFAAALSQDGRPVSQLNLAGACVAVGNEAAGLPGQFIAQCDAVVHIPISPRCESLNAAMAATVFAWEMSNSRGEHQ